MEIEQFLWGMNASSSLTYLSQFRLQLNLGLRQLHAALAEGLLHSGALDSQVLCGVLQDLLCQSPGTSKHRQTHASGSI